MCLLSLSPLIYILFFPSLLFPHPPPTPPPLPIPSLPQQAEQGAPGGLPTFCVKRMSMAPLGRGSDPLDSHFWHLGGRRGVCNRRGKQSILSLASVVAQSWFPPRRPSQRRFFLSQLTRTPPHPPTHKIVRRGFVGSFILVVVCLGRVIVIHGGRINT